MKIKLIYKGENQMIKKLKVLLLSAVVAVGTWGCAKNDKIGTKENYKINSLKLEKLIISSTKSQLSSEN